MFDFPLLVTVMALEIEYIILGRYDLLLNNGYVNICPLNLVCKVERLTLMTEYIYAENVKKILLIL